MLSFHELRADLWIHMIFSEQFYESRPRPDMARLTPDERSRALDDAAAWEKTAYWDGIPATTFTIKGIADPILAYGVLRETFNE